MSIKFVTLAAIGLIGLTIAPATHAQSVSRTVSYGDLNLTNSVGIERLDRRIVNAAKAVCENGDTSLHGRMTANECRAEAIAGTVEARAMAIAGSGGVLALNTARNRRPVR